MSDEAFYVTEGDRLRATPWTRGPWDPDAQHGGPVAALLGRVIENIDGRDDLRVVRVTIEILGPVPIAPLTATARIGRNGRRIQLVEATLSTGGEPVALARAWRLHTTNLELSPAPAAPPTAPGAGEASEFFPTGQELGWHHAMDIRFVTGGFLEPGPATAWLRPRIPLVAGEPLSPLARVLLAADAGNGLSGTLDFRRWLFINPDLTVSLHRQPVGDSVCLDASTAIAPDGTGVASSQISDEEGPLGHALQSLLVAPRRSALT